MSELYDTDRKPLKDGSAGIPLISEAVIFTGSKRWIMLKKDDVLSPVRAMVGHAGNSYSAVRDRILLDTGISVGTGAVLFTGLFSAPEGAAKCLMDIWVFRLSEKDDELKAFYPGLCTVSSDEAIESFENGSFSDLGETEKLRGIFTICETPVCVDF